MLFQVHLYRTDRNTEEIRLQHNSSYIQQKQLEHIPFISIKEWGVGGEFNIANPILVTTLPIDVHDIYKVLK